MTEAAEPGVWQDVPSPFCGIAADDLSIQVEGQQLKVLDNGCAVTTPLFEHPITDTAPRVRGRETDLATAITHAAGVLRDTHSPLIGGLATDVHGMRAALALGDRLGAVIDNMNSTAAMRNLLTVANSGMMNTTLAEVKNRADVLVIVGCDLEPLFPRFFERYIWNADSMFVQPAEREIIFLGTAPAGQAAVSPDGRTPTVMPCALTDLPQVVAALRARLKGQTLSSETVAGVALKDLNALADRLRQARYGVITWAAGALDYPHAELTVQTLSFLIKELNAITRCSGLPLGGKEGDQTANQVCGWISGNPVRTSFARGYPEYDPYLNETGRLLAQDEVDALLWVSAFNADRSPPDTGSVPLIALGRSGMVFEREPEVFIPVGTPGIDHSGHAYRTDNVVAVRLRQLRDSGLPTTAEILTAIEQAL